MSDEVLNIKLTAREIDLLHQCISTNMETVKRRHDPSDPMIRELLAELGELSDDLLEQRFNPEDPDLFMDPVDFAAKHDADPISIAVCDTEINAETQMFNAGAEAREKVKASSRAAERRTLNFSAREAGERSEIQDHDVWAKPSNDPADW
jgi:hypothetical protein